MPHLRLQLLLLLGLACLARPLGAAVFDASGARVPDSEAGSGRVAWSPLRPEDGLTGVGVLGVWPLGDVCTATLLDTGPDSGPAYLLTNAHCNFFEHLGADSLDAEEYRVQQPTSYHVTFRHLVSVPAQERIRIALRRLTYVTEFSTDVALFEADATLGALKARGIRPLRIATAPPAPGDAVSLIGAPLLYVPAVQRSLHRSTCRVQHTVALRNGIYRAPRSVVHQCSSVPGFSGGPLLSPASEIVLLNSHGADDNSTFLADCTYESRPCEVEPDGREVVRQDHNYAQHVTGIRGCFDAAGRFDLLGEACGLPPRSPRGGFEGGGGCSVGPPARAGAPWSWSALLALAAALLLARRPGGNFRARRLVIGACTGHKPSGPRALGLSRPDPFDSLRANFALTYHDDRHHPD